MRNNKRPTKINLLLPVLHDSLHPQTITKLLFDDVQTLRCRCMCVEVFHSMPDLACALQRVLIVGIG